MTSPYATEGLQNVLIWDCGRVPAGPTPDQLRDLIEQFNRETSWPVVTAGFPEFPNRTSPMVLGHVVALRADGPRLFADLAVTGGAMVTQEFDGTWRLVGVALGSFKHPALAKDE